MLIMSENGWRPFTILPPAPKAPAACVAIHKAWVSARNFSIDEWNRGVERAHGAMKGQSSMPRLELPDWCR